MSPEAEPVGQSFLSWTFSALGVYAFLLPLAGFICFVLTLIVIVRGKGPMAVAALLLIVHVPLLIAIFAALQGAIASYTIIATSGSAPKPSEVAVGISTVLVALQVAMLVMVPAYGTASLGAFIRSLAKKAESSQSE